MPFHPRRIRCSFGEQLEYPQRLCDDYSGSKALFAQGVTEAGCLAHARRKFHELWVNHKSTRAEQALGLLGRLYDVGREVADLPADERRIRRARAKPAAEGAAGSATAKAMDYSLTRWAPLTRYLDDGELPAGNNRMENQIRPIGIARKNWLFAGSFRAGKRAAAIMSLMHSARIKCCCKTPRA